MAKILSQTGISLADTYDVEGSIAGIDQLDSDRVALVHEMGSTIFSERLVSSIRRMATAAIAQNINFDLVITDLPATPFRVLNVTVLSDGTADRIANATVSLRTEFGDREILIWLFNGTDIDGRFDEDVLGLGRFNMMQPVPGISPVSLGLGSDQREGRVGEIAFRGTTTGFGAGTVSCVALIHIAHTHVGGISSFGLPLPGW